MATHTSPSPAPSLSNLSLSSYSQVNHIDLTLDDNDNTSYSPRFAKRARTEDMSNHLKPLQSPPVTSFNGLAPPSMSTFHPSNLKPATVAPNSSQLPPNHLNGPTAPIKDSSSDHPPNIYRPAFDRSPFVRPSQSPSHPPRLYIPPVESTSRTIASFHTISSSISSNRSSAEESDRQIIDLTGSPSPPPVLQRQFVPISLPPDLPPKTPVCIGQLTVTALVLYPVAYLLPQEQGSSEAEWASVRLQHEHNPNKPGVSETIHIKVPPGRATGGDSFVGEGFGVVAQKVATALGPMLGKGLIRLDAKVRKGLPNVSVHTTISSRCPILPACLGSHTSLADASIHAERKHSCCRKLFVPMRSPSRPPIASL